MRSNKNVHKMNYLVIRIYELIKEFKNGSTDE